MARARRGSVLVVEDDAETRGLFKLALYAAGFHVVEAADGVEALRILDLATPTLLVLDLGLPRLSGRDVARELAARADTESLPIVVVTGLEPDDLPAPASLYILRKPVDPDIVVRTVEECLTARAARRTSGV